MATRTRTDGDAGKAAGLPVMLHELDRARLVREIALKGRTLRPGLEGVVVYCHGRDAYEVEFPGISDFFQIPSEYLEKS